MSIYGARRTTGRRSVRIARLVAVVVVTLGCAGAVIEVARGIQDQRVEFRGALDAPEILRQYHSSAPERGDPREDFERRDLGHLVAADGLYARPDADTADLISWSVAVLLPWLVAAAALALAVPVLRAAERGDPFSDDATRRLGRVGLLLMLGIPFAAVARAVAATIADEGGVLPDVSVALTIELAAFLPGLFVLALAGVFRIGADLRDFDRHAV